jgi:hypothetical protein
LLFFIVYGWRNVVSHLSTGDFHCPHCGRFAAYQLKQFRPFGTLFFIPILPMGGATRFVECSHCGSQFHEDVLDYRPSRGSEGRDDRDTADVPSGPAPSVADQVQAIERELLAGTSVGRMQAQLEEKGYPKERAEALIAELCGGETKECRCGRRYHPRAVQCGECRVPL